MALAIMLLILGCSYALSPQTAVAATTTEMYVNAKNDIFLRTKPNQNADKLGTIKDHSKFGKRRWVHLFIQQGESCLPFFI